MIKFIDLAAVNNRFRDEISVRIGNILDKGWYLNGDENSLFCKHFAEYCGVKHAIGVANGSDALRLIIKAHDFAPGDEIIVPANTFIATVLAVSDNGCVPVLAETDINTYNIDPAAIPPLINNKTKAIIAVHLYGRAAPMREICAVAEKYGLKVFEDAAQAHGAEYDGKRVGSMSDAAAFSFYPGKNLGCMGDGGAVVSDDKDLIAKIKTLANYGADIKYHHVCKGCNSRLDEVQAAILDVKLKYLDSDNVVRRKIAACYRESITNPRIILPQLDDELSHVWHVFAVRTAERDRFRQYLTANRVETIIHYPVPPHKQPAFRELNNLSYPVTEEICDTVISLPMSPIMSDHEVKTVIDVVNGYR